jgi:signal transduction histidine kinase
LAHVAAVSLRRKQAEEALRKRNLDLELLNRAAHTFSSTLDLDQVLATALEEIRNFLGVAACSVWLVDDEKGDLVCRQASGPGNDVVRGWHLAPGEGIVGWVVGQGESLVVPDARADRRHFPGVEREIGFELRSILCVPLRANQDVVGAIQVLDKEVGRFAQADLVLIEPLAATAAAAIENARLYEAVRRELAERKRAEEERERLLEQVRAGQEQLRNLAGYLQAAREAERTLIAREIHDEFGQTLTALKMDLAWLARQLPGDDQPRLADKLKAMSSLLDTTLETVRRVAAQLRPGLLDDLGLVEALQWQAQEFSEHTAIKCELRLGEAEIRLGRDLDTAIFRIVQEALTNVARHAGATQVRLEMEATPDGWLLTIQDNGRGITDGQLADPKSLGLIGMRERARVWGGDITFHGVPGQGTTVSVYVPKQAAGKDAP